MNDRHRRGRNDVDVDLVIDRAVREIMSAEPRAGFRQRVLRRLDERPQAGRTGWHLGLAAAVVTVILLVMLLPRPAERRPETSVVQERLATTTPQPKAPQPAEPTGIPAIPSKPAIPAQAPATIDRPQAASAAAQTQPAPGRVEATSLLPIESAAVAFPPALDETVREPNPFALDAIEPILIAPIVTPPIVLPELTIKPITVERIQIPSVSPPR
jgi:hypothetical protein